jgi:hypothetical protein
MTQIFFSYGKTKLMYPISFSFEYWGQQAFQPICLPTHIGQVLTNLSKLKNLTFVAALYVSILRLKLRKHYFRRAHQGRLYVNQ